MTDHFIPVTYYPVETQKVRTLNAERIKGTALQPFFDDRIELAQDVLPALQKPLRIEDALQPTPKELNRLLEPGYLPGESGYCAFPDGTGYAASLTRFPGCTPAMFRWWFWWHSFAAERYSLWFPWNHVSIRRDDGWKETAPGLTDEQRYIGSTHHITEYIGPHRLDIDIIFVDPSELGFATGRFAAAGIAGHACGEVYLQNPRLHIGTMVHLIRETDDGFELRSRYWLAHKVKLSVLGHGLDLDRVAGVLGIKKLLSGPGLAYEQLVHDQIEFTHLARILPAVYAEFGPSGR
jgi:hypothetical protein